jgi:hypothetical protein
MNKKALIIFVRNPVPGKVKTRIAEAVGEDKALHIYKELLQHTHDIAVNIAADKYVFYSEYVQPGDSWEDDSYQKLLQAGKTLGDKMSNAFSCLFGESYEKIVIIGSDCYELTTEIIEQAFESLSDKDTVIGPAQDGGYYLLGMKKMIPGVFENKNWSTSSVFNSTIQDFEKAGIRYKVLPVLKDIDTIEDIPPHLFNQWRIS